MKHFILPAIILLPVATLALWCYYGAKQPRLPTGRYGETTNTPAQTNLISPLHTN
jgi:hypothetical protein